MSHIPSAAMPHAKPHEHQDHQPTVAPPIKRDALPWGALVAGGVLAIGGAVTAAWLLRGDKQRQPSRGSSAKRKSTGGTSAKRTGRSRKPKSKATGTAAT